LEERNVVLKNAEYITNQIGMVLPCTNIFRNAFNFMGIYMYHYLGKILSKDVYIFNKPKFLFSQDMESIFPSLNKKYKYGVLMFDG